MATLSLPGPGADSPPRRVTWIVGTDDSESRIREGLASHGWVDGRNLSLAFERRFDEPELARIVAARPDAIAILRGGHSLNILRNLTRDIPIVFYNSSGNPLRSGVASLARPGGNVTGAIVPWSEIIGKQWELLKAIRPSMRRGAYFDANLDRPRNENEAEHGEVLRATGERLGIEIREIELPRTASASAMEEAVRAARVEALQCEFPVTPDLIAFVSRTKIPTAGFTIRRARLGGAIIGVAFKWDEGESQAVGMVARILRGERPATMPIYMNREYRFALNLGVAGKAGIEIPPSVRIRAQEVFQ